MQRTTQSSEWCIPQNERKPALLRMHGILTSPVKDRRIFKCCIIISQFSRKSKRFSGFFSIRSKSAGSRRGIYGKIRQRIKGGGSETGTAAQLVQITAAPEHRPDMYLRRRRTRDMRPHQSHTCRRPQRSRRPDMHLHMHRTGCKHR